MRLQPQPVGLPWTWPRLGARQLSAHEHWRPPKGIQRFTRLLDTLIEGQVVGDPNGNAPPGFQISPSFTFWRMRFV